LPCFGIWNFCIGIFSPDGSGILISVAKPKKDIAYSRFPAPKNVDKNVKRFASKTIITFGEL
jgi:hypothetical protein